jgi:hypothetical protein
MREQVGVDRTEHVLAAGGQQVEEEIPVFDLRPINTLSVRKAENLA